MATAKEALIANVERELHARGWSRKRLAEECGWPPSRITEMLRGDFSPRLGRIERVAEAFGITVSALLMPPPESPSKAVSAA